MSMDRISSAEMGRQQRPRSWARSWHDQVAKSSLGPASSMRMGGTASFSSPQLNASGLDANGGLKEPNSARTDTSGATSSALPQNNFDWSKYRSQITCL